ncbi:PUA domain containing protein, partial [Halobium palmae]
MSDNAELPDLRTVADYQFGAGAGAALFPPTEDVRVSRSTS